MVVAQPPGGGQQRGQAGLGGRGVVGVGLVVQDHDGDGFAARSGDLVDAAVDVDRVDPPRPADAAGTGEDVVVEHGPGQQPRTGRGVADRVSAAADPGSGGGAGADAGLRRWPGEARARSAVEGCGEAVQHGRDALGLADNVAGEILRAQGERHRAHEAQPSGSGRG